MKMAKSSTISAGIDTLKAKLEIAVYGGASFTVSNDETSWKQAAVRLREASVARIGIEASRGYKRGATWALRDAGFSFVDLQSLQIKAFAKLVLKRAKNDRIDG